MVVIICTSAYEGCSPPVGRGEGAVVSTCMQAASGVRGVLPTEHPTAGRGGESVVESAQRGEEGRLRTLERLALLHRVEDEREPISLDLARQAEEVGRASLVGAAGRGHHARRLRKGGVEEPDDVLALHV
jgi:hypothetical protein